MKLRKERKKDRKNVYFYSERKKKKDRKKLIYIVKERKKEKDILWTKEINAIYTVEVKEGKKKRRKEKWIEIWSSPNVLWFFYVRVTCWKAVDPLIIGLFLAE